MGNQFNYELDDRQIKLTMLSATVSAEENAWDKFKHIPTAETKHFTTITTNIPKFEMGISRSIIVPVVFIVLIGGLSALLFNLIDFKKTEKVNTEIPLEIPHVTEKTNIPKVIHTEKQNSSTETLVVSTPTKTIEPKLQAVVLTPSVTNASITAKTQSVTAKITTNNSPEKKVEQSNLVAIKQNTISTTTITPRKKKKPKEAVEEIPVIVPQTTILSNEPAVEPEIEIQ